MKLPTIITVSAAPELVFIGYGAKTTDEQTFTESRCDCHPRRTQSPQRTRSRRGHGKIHHLAEHERRQTALGVAIKHSRSTSLSAPYLSKQLACRHHRGLVYQFWTQHCQRLLRRLHSAAYRLGVLRQHLQLKKFGVDRRASWPINGGAARLNDPAREPVLNEALSFGRRCFITKKTYGEERPRPCWTIVVESIDSIERLAVIRRQSPGARLPQHVSVRRNRHSEGRANVRGARPDDGRRTSLRGPAQLLSSKPF